MRNWGIVLGRKRANSAYFAFSASLHWSSINSIWRFGGELSTSTANGLLSSSNLLFCASKSANRRRKSAASTLCAREHTGRELFFHGLAARKLAQVFFPHLCLPQSQFGFKRLHCAVHIRDHTIPTLQLQVHCIQMSRDVTQKCHFTQKCFISELSLSLYCPRTDKSPHAAQSIFAAPFPGLAIAPQCDRANHHAPFLTRSEMP